MLIRRVTKLSGNGRRRLFVVPVVFNTIVAAHRNQRRSLLAPSQQEIAVRSALESVMDPEIGLSVIDLGLIREVHYLPGQTLIKMMLTTPFCPYAPQMVADVKQAVVAVIPQVCEVDLMPDPWSPDLMPDPGLLGYSF